MKDAVITVRVPQATRERLRELARREGRSLSQQVERLIERAMTRPGTAAIGRQRARSLSGVLRSGRVPTLADFREARRMLSTSLVRRSRGHADR